MVMVKNKFRAGSQRVQVKFARFRSQTQTRAAEGGTFCHPITRIQT